MWKFIRDVYTVSYTVSYTILCNWMWKFIRDVYTVSYFVTVEVYKRRSFITG